MNKLLCRAGIGLILSIASAAAKDAPTSPHALAARWPVGGAFTPAPGKGCASHGKGDSVGLLDRETPATTATIAIADHEPDAIVLDAPSARDAGFEPLPERHAPRPRAAMKVGPFAGPFAVPVADPVGMP